MGQLRNVFRGVLVDPESQLGGEPHGPQQPHWIFGKALARVADQPQVAGLDVPHAVDIIHHGLILYVVEQGVDGEITPPYIIIYVAVNIVADDLAVDDAPFPVGLMVMGRAKSGDLDDFLLPSPPVMNMGQPKAAAYQDAVSKKLPDLLRSGVGDHIEILWLAP